MDDSTLSLRDVLRRLNGVRTAGDQFQARCPSHDDQHPSLTVTETTQGKILLHCKAGCSFEEVCHGLGVEPQQLFPPGEDDSAKRRRRQADRNRLREEVKKREAKRATATATASGKASWKPTRSRAVATYEYNDRAGRILAKIVRYEVEEGHDAYPDKTFRPFAYLPNDPDSNANGFVWGLRGMDLPLYREGEARAAIEENDPVFVVEGEKDVDNLREIGCTAVTAAGGAAKWRRDHTRALLNGHIILIPDNDDAGHEHAITVANDLSGVAASVRVLHLDDDRKGYDASDWLGDHPGLSADEKRERLLQLARETKEHAPGQPYTSTVGDGLSEEPTLAAYDVDPSHERFFYADEKRDRISINRGAWMRWLHARGYRKYYPGDEAESETVRVEGSILHRVSHNERIRDEALSYAANLADDEVPGEYTSRDVYDALLRGANVWFTDALLKCLKPIDPDFAEDGADYARFYFQNGFVKVTADGFDLHDYSELDGMVWSNRIIDRPFEDLRGADGYQTWDWHRHLWYVSGQDVDRFNALCTSLGYLLHDYKDPAETRAVVFMDEKVSHVEEGRTGKSLTAKGISQLVPTQRMDGRNFSFDSRFAWQSVDARTSVVDFNDASRGFAFDRMFAVITDDMTIERKNRDRFQLPFSDSPKFLISTNYVVEGSGPSFDERVFQVEFYPYYTANRTPLDIFGTRFFDGWDAAEWARFDNIMMACVRQFLRDGLHEYEHVNLPYKQLQNATTTEFAQWVLRQEPGEYNKKALFASFKDAFPEYEDLRQRRWTEWMQDFCSIYHYDLEERYPGSKQLIKWKPTPRSITRRRHQGPTTPPPSDTMQADAPDEQHTAGVPEQAAMWTDDDNQKPEEPDEWPARSNGPETPDRRTSDPDRASPTHHATRDHESAPRVDQSGTGNPGEDNSRENDSGENDSGEDDPGTHKTRPSP